MSDKIDPRKVFYLAIAVDNLDGSVEFDADCNATFIAERGAAEYASEIAEEHGGEFVICQCTPIKRVYRPKVSVEAIEAPTRQRSRRAKERTPAPESNGTPYPLAAARDVVEAERQITPTVPDLTPPDFLRREKADA